MWWIRCSKWKIRSCAARSGLPDLANTVVHASWEECLEQLPGRIFAFTAHTELLYTEVDYVDGDALLFGPEPTGLPDHIMHHERVTDLVRIPMVDGNRSLNLANSAAIGLYEAWRQLGLRWPLSNLLLALTS